MTGALDERTPHDIGRRARLELVFGVRGGRTALIHAYAEPPLRVGRCFPHGDGVHLILASSAPGVFGGDSFDQMVTVERGAQVRLTSQSAMQVHPSPEGASATLTSAFRVAQGGQLQCEWHPAIPFPHARLVQHIDIDLEADARLWWSDAVMSGREARGERWQFDRLAHELRVSCAGALRYLERYSIEPSVASPERRWIADRACYFGTLLGRGVGFDRSSAEVMHSRLRGTVGVETAADFVDDELLLVRLAGASGARFHEARNLAMQIACSSMVPVRASE